MQNTSQQDITEIESGLDSFSAVIRKNYFVTLMGMADAGLLSLPTQQEIGNLHCHTFYSYNGYGYSPTHIAWLGRKLGAQFMGIVDFDVLDGVDEFLEACEMVNLRGSAGMETRVYIPELANLEINSPGEPGVCYHMGIGFTNSQAPRQAAGLLRSIRTQAARRNQEMLKKINAFLFPLTLDYNDDILPSTPNHNATERHMLDQILARAQSTTGNPLQFWSEKLDMSVQDLEKLIDQKGPFSALVRKKLMKKGGVGYIPPSPQSFPSLDELNRIIRACGALPCYAWLDGTSAGERDVDALLDLMIEKGVVAVNIIPDRNWNLKDPDDKSRKLNNLYQFVSAAQQRNLPINVGTEMNSYGQKWMDDFSARELDPVRNAFIDGAYFIYGHTRMQKLWGLGWQSQWAAGHFPQTAAKNDFYIHIGRQLSPQGEPAYLNGVITDQMDPQEILNTLRKLKEKQING